MSATKITACIILSVVSMVVGQPANSYWTGHGYFTDTCPYNCNANYVKNAAGACVLDTSGSTASPAPATTAANSPSTATTAASQQTTPAATAASQQTTPAATASTSVTSPGTTLPPGTYVKYSMGVPFLASFASLLPSSLGNYKSSLGTILGIDPNRISVIGNMIPGQDRASITFSILAENGGNAQTLATTIQTAAFKTSWENALSATVFIGNPEFQVLGITSTTISSVTTTAGSPTTSASTASTSSMAAQTASNTATPQQTPTPTSPPTTAAPQPGTYVNFDLQIAPTTTVTQASLDGIIQTYRTSLSTLLSVPESSISITARIVTTTRRRRLLANTVILSTSILAPTSGIVTTANILSNVQSSAFSSALQTSTGITSTVAPNSIQVQTVTTPAPAQTPAPTTQPAAPPPASTTILAATTTAAADASASSDTNTLLIVAIAVPAGIVVIVIIVVVVWCSVKSSNAKETPPPPQQAASQQPPTATPGQSRFKAFRFIPLKTRANPRVNAQLALKMNP